MATRTKTRPTAEIPIHHDTLVKAVREAMKRYFRKELEATDMVLKSPDGKFVLAGKGIRRYEEVFHFSFGKKPFGLRWTPKSEDEIKICAEGFAVMKQELALVHRGSILERELQRLRDAKSTTPKK